MPYRIIVFLIIILSSCKRDCRFNIINRSYQDTILLYTSFSINDSFKSCSIIIQRQPNTKDFKIFCENKILLNNIKYYFNCTSDSIYSDSIIFYNNNCTGIDSIIKVINWKYNKIYQEKEYNILTRELIKKREITNDGFILNTWYMGGQLRSVEKFKNHSISEYKIWNKNGNLEQEKIIIENNIITRHWYENGKIMEESIENLYTNQAVMSRTWCENGLLIDSSLYNIGIFERKRYYCNGKLKDKWIYLNVPDYPYEVNEWYENGNRKFIGHFKKSITPLIGGTPNGKWTFYNLNGIIVRTEFYLNGKLTSVKGNARDKIN